MKIRDMKSFLKVSKALSDPNRIKMIKLLEQGERCVCEIQAVLGLAQPTISKHLKVLEEAGLVLSRKQGMWVLYRLPRQEEVENRYAQTMLELLGTWLNDDPEIKSALGKLSELELRDTFKRKSNPRS